MMSWIETIWPRLRRGAAGGRARLELVDRLALGPQHWLHLVRVGQQELLIGRSPSGLTLLAPLPPSNPHPEEAP